MTRLVPHLLQLLLQECSSASESCICVVWLTQEELRTGEKAVVLFKFIKHPEYLKVGAKVLFREGLTKGIGHVTMLQPITQYEMREEEP